MITLKSTGRKVIASRSYGNKPVGFKQPGGPRNKPKTLYI